MASAKGGQKFIKENRAPRVHIEYEVETFGSRQKVEIPFVVGVMSDLSGKSQVEKKALDKRDFVEFDMDNFEQKMESMAPRAAFTVENTLTGEGQMGVDLTFKSLEDFSPGQIAKNLMLYMDGKDGAQGLLDKVLKDPELMKALAAAKPPAEDGDAPA
jgi:type VI secretion system protein ImpB